MTYVLLKDYSNTIVGFPDNTPKKVIDKSVYAIEHRGEEVKKVKRQACGKAKKIKL